jgi:hypothetical protein
LVAPKVNIAGAEWVSEWRAINRPYSAVFCATTWRRAPASIHLPLALRYAV